MPLSVRLRDVPLTFLCPHCQHPLIRKGSWFTTVAHFKCDGCGTRVRITYPQKVALFAGHGHLADGALKHVVSLNDSGFPE